MPGLPSWASGGFGFKNAITALPILYKDNENNQISTTPAPMWVPGEGILKPVMKDMIYAWFYSNFGGANAEISMDDFSPVKELVFRADRASTAGKYEVTYNASEQTSWGQLTFVPTPAHDASSLGNIGGASQ
jgi:hypothetical protein